MITHVDSQSTARTQVTCAYAAFLNCNVVRALCLACYLRCWMSVWILDCSGHCSNSSKNLPYIFSRDEACDVCVIITCMNSFSSIINP